MTESEWLESIDPRAMLDFLRGKAGDRKRRLFACACCRLVWDRLTDERSRRAVEIAEAFADGAIDAARLARADAEAATVVRIGEHSAAWMAVWAADEQIVRVVGQTLNECRFGNLLDSAVQAALLRDLFANPFRPVAFDPGWLAWNDGTVRKLARAIYDGGAFDQTPLLADALEEAGCGSRDILDHCRSGAGHARGCWAVDGLLGNP